MRFIQPIVEGQGDVEAVPVVLRRLRDEAQAWDLEVARPHRRTRGELARKDTLQRAVQVAALREDCAGIMIVFDADDDCPKELAPIVQGWAEEVSGSLPCKVVMANREFEAWFLASIEELRGQRSIRGDATSHNNPEQPRDAKGCVEDCMHDGGSYSETADQAALAAGISLSKVYQQCRSFRRLVNAFGGIATSAGVELAQWPPQGW